MRPSIDDEGYLDYSQIKPKTIIMIDFVNRTMELFFIASTEPGKYDGRLMIRGLRLNNIIEDPTLVPFPFPNDFCEFNKNQKSEKDKIKLELFLSGNAGNPCFKPEDVSGYRNLTPKERAEWIKKITCNNRFEELKRILEKG